MGHARQYLDTVALYPGKHAQEEAEVDPKAEVACSGHLLQGSLLTVVLYVPAAQALQRPLTFSYPLLQMQRVFFGQRLHVKPLYPVNPGMHRQSYLEPLATGLKPETYVLYLFSGQAVQGLVTPEPQRVVDEGVVRAWRALRHLVETVDVETAVRGAPEAQVAGGRILVVIPGCAGAVQPAGAPHLLCSGRFAGLAEGLTGCVLVLCDGAALAVGAPGLVLASGTLTADPVDRRYETGGTGAACRRTQGCLVRPRGAEAAGSAVGPRVTGVALAQRCRVEDRRCLVQVDVGWVRHEGGTGSADFVPHKGLDAVGRAWGAGAACRLVVVLDVAEALVPVNVFTVQNQGVGGAVCTGGRPYARLVLVEVALGAGPAVGPRVARLASAAGDANGVDGAD
eukprot:765506-Hanusia_phi.AAC.7